MNRLPDQHPLRKARWIWPQSYMYLVNHFAQFRRDFRQVAPRGQPCDDGTRAARRRARRDEGWREQPVGERAGDLRSGRDLSGRRLILKTLHG